MLIASLRLHMVQSLSDPFKVTLLMKTFFLAGLIYIIFKLDWKFGNKFSMGGSSAKQNQQISKKLQ